MWAYARVVHGMPKPMYIKAMADLNRREFFTFIPLIVLTVWLGVKPRAVLDSLSSSIVYLHQASLKSFDFQQATELFAKEPVNWVVDFIASIE
jgi:NADH:ubiquinone oxidoreductase subunit 4 (subunit M)